MLQVNLPTRTVDDPTLIHTGAIMLSAASGFPKSQGVLLSVITPALLAVAADLEDNCGMPNGTKI
jgi:hypothetical protein